MEVAVMFLQMVKGQTEEIFAYVTTKEKQKERAPALNTVELMRVASSGLGLGPQHAMTIAEKLCIQGYISYPRSTQYADSFNLKDVVRQQQHSFDWGDICRELLGGGMAKPRKGHDAAADADASIPVHINNICTRNYCTVESGRRLVPSNLGIVLVHDYLKKDPVLVKPTSWWRSRRQ